MVKCLRIVMMVLYMGVEKIAFLWKSRWLYLVKNYNVYTYIGFGVIDRGTNVLQVRPTTICPLNCIFCSVDAGPKSRYRIAEFMVEYHALLKTINEITRFKGGGVEILIDTIGEGLTYPHIFELIKELRKNPLITAIALETHGSLLTKEIIDHLNEAGLSRINLSIDTFNPEKARYLQGVKWYNVEKIKKLAEYIVRETNIDLHVTPIWIPGINDDDVIEIVKWAYEIGAGKKWPPATIQKYNVHKYGRKIPGVKELSWNSFWKWIREFEEKYGYRVSWSMEEWGMYRTRKYPCPYKVGEKIVVEIIAPGIFKGEYLGVDHRRNTVFAVIGKGIKLKNHYLVEVIENKDCLVIARAIKQIHI